jgi:hypothetical protein
MVTPDSDSNPAEAKLDDDPSRPATNLATTEGQTRLVAMALVAGLLAGVAAWLVSETILEAYREILAPKVQRGADANVVRRFARAQLESALGTFTALGAILGLGMGLAGGLARRSPAGGAKAALVGCVVGSAAGAIISLIVLPLFFKTHDPQSQDLTLPLLTLGSICSAVGAAGGLAFGIGLGRQERWLKSLVGGLVGGTLAAVVYEVVGAIAFATDRTELPISQTHVTRAMLHVLIGTLAGVGAALGLSLSSRKRNAGPSLS